MSALGTAQTKNFQIGNAELRIGTLSNAGKLKQTDSVGLLQSANANFQQSSVELKGGLPLQLIDSVITETSVTVTAQAYEYTRKNIRAMLNEGVVDPNAEKDFVFETAPLSGSVTGASATSITVTGAAAVAGSALPTWASDLPSGTLIGVYKKGSPEDLSIVTLTANASATTLSFAAGSLLFNYAATDVLVVYKLNPVGLGKAEKTTYYTIDLLSKNHNSGVTQGFRFWKASIQGGMDYSFSNDSFAVTPLTFKVLLPTTEEIAAGGELAHVAGIQVNNPLGMFWNGQLK
jgi:hypothetical protein